MKQYDLLRKGESIIRVVALEDNSLLIMDCIKRTMPIRVAPERLEGYSLCTAEDLYQATELSVTDIDSLDSDQRKVMYERYTMITPILPYIADEKVRTRLIRSVAEEHGISTQTLRSYLCLYLSYMDIAVLAPKKRDDSRTLTQDEKNMRWALNKFFYTKRKNSLTTAYTLMLKEKYCGPMGELSEEYPSFYQFRYCLKYEIANLIDLLALVHKQL